MDFYLTEDQVKECLDNEHVELTDESIPSTRFGEHEITCYAFGEKAEEYGKFLEKNNIHKMPLWLAGMYDKPFARKVWFRGLGGSSDLVGFDRVMYGGFGVRGVR